LLKTFDINFIDHVLKILNSKGYKFISLEAMKNTACDLCNLNKIGYKNASIWPAENNRKKHEVQSGHLIWDGESLFFKNIAKAFNFLRAIFWILQ